MKRSNSNLQTNTLQLNINKINTKNKINKPSNNNNINLNNNNYVPYTKAKVNNSNVNINTIQITNSSNYGKENLKSNLIRGHSVGNNNNKNTKLIPNNKNIIINNKKPIIAENKPKIMEKNKLTTNINITTNKNTGTTSKNIFGKPSEKYTKIKSSDPFDSGKKHKTNFAYVYSAGGIPCRIHHGAINMKLKWDIEPESKNII
jgi:hypothetical protein